MSDIAVRNHAWARYAIAALCAFAMVLVGLWAAPSPAHAADTPTVLDSVEFQQHDFRDQSVQTLSVDWHATESPASPTVTVAFDLPPELHGQVSTFSIGNGTCQVTSDHVTCTVDDDYVLNNPLNVHGSFTIRVQVDLKNTETVPDATFTVGGVSTPPVSITSRYCTQNCEFGGYGGPGKGGSYNNTTDNIGWTVTVPTRGDGVTSEDGGLSLAAGQTVRITDLYDEQGNPFTLVAGSPTLQRASCLVTNQWNEQSLVWTSVSPADYTVLDDGHVIEFTTAAGSGCGGQDPANDPVPLTGSVYRANWTVHAEDGGKGVTGPGQYHNDATIAINGVERQTGGNATRFTNSGVAIGENYARFELRKVFDVDDDVLVPGSITVDYTIAYPGGVPAPTSGTITLGAGNGWQYVSPEIFQGSTITLTEANPWPGNVDASSTLTIGGSPVTAAPDGSYTFTADHTTTPLEYTLTNRAALDSQALAARKVIENPDGVSIPAGTAFQLNASWPADPALALNAGSTSIALPADGSVVSFAGLPVGANVTFTETAPAAIPGATWESSTVSPATLTIGPDADDVTVTATNVLSRDVGTFTITKELTGDAAGLVTDPTFEVSYSYPADPSLGIEAGSGTVEVEAGGAPASVTAPAGAVVTLSETPIEVAGGTWATPAFDPGSTFTVVQDLDVAIALTNLITLDTGAFSIHKVVDGDAAASLPAGTRFHVHYSYPAGIGFAAGDGELTVAAGATVTSPELPYGAVVTLTEAEPAAVANATWSTPRFSAATITIGDGTTIAVTLTNTLTDPSLASTGWAAAPVVVPAILLILAGLALIVMRSRRRA